MSSRSLLSYCAGLLLLTPALAHATNAAELYELPWPQACETELGVMGLLVQARDKGISPTEARETVRKLRPDLPVSKELMANVFDHPDLGPNPLERYTLWSCHARAHKVPVLPLKAVAADMRECYAASAPYQCALILQNRITGLAADFKPGSSMKIAPAQAIPSAAPPAR